MSKVWVQEYKYDRQKHYSYPLTLLADTAELIIGYGAFGRPLSHPGKGMTNHPMQNQSIEFHFKHRPYSIAASFYADGRLRRYYCNVATPSTFAEGVISFIDLDLDLVVTPDLAYTVQDEDEFEAHRIAYNYPPEVEAMAREGLAELIRLVETRAYPFDGTAPALLQQRLRGCKAEA